MQYIHSKDIFMLMRDTLKLFDRRLMDHGSKVAYYVYKMLQYKGGYEEYELADIVFLVTFHDIGAYRTDNIDEMIKFETKAYKPHTLYGYLFMENLTSMGEMAKVILYHHMDYAQLEKIYFEYRDIASYVNLAERIDIFKESLGEKFNIGIFEKHLGTRISREAYELFRNADAKYGVFDKINSKEYKKELEGLTEYFILPNEDKEKLSEILMFFQALKSDEAISNAVTTLALSEKIGMLMGLNEEQLRILRYAGYVHDIGMLAIPKEMDARQGKLSKKEAEKIKQHVLLSVHLLRDRMKTEITSIVATHHERTDGSGYPQKLTEKQMNMSQMILQFADAVSILISSKAEAPKEKIIEIVRIQAEEGTFSKAVVKVFLENYDEIVDYIINRSKEIMDNYSKISIRFEKEMLRKEE